MKKFCKLSVLGSVLLASASFAHATTVSGTLNYANDLSSYFVFTGSGSSMVLTFTGPANVTTPTSGFAGLSTGYDVATFTGPITLASLPSTSIFTVSEGTGATANVIKFIATGYSISQPSGFTDIAFSGTALESVGGVAYTSAPAVFTFDTQGSAGSMASYSGSLSTVATPEPGSLVLLGTGLMGGAGLLFRKRVVA